MSGARGGLTHGQPTLRPGRGEHATRSDYQIQGMRVAAWSVRSDVHRALDRRLGRYRTTGAAQGADLTLRYVAELPGVREASPAGAGRVVYEPGGGVVRHVAETDELHAEVRGVRMRAQLRRGLVHIAGGTWTGARRYVATHTLTTLVLMEALKRRGRFPLHAGCLASDGRAVLIAGTSGAGKSTLSLALARRGLDYLSDDLVFLRPGSGGPPEITGFADAVGVADTTVQLLPELAGAAQTEPGFPKRLVCVDDVFTTRIVAAGRPHALVFPQVAGPGPSMLEPVPPDEAWLRLIPDVLLTEPRSSQAHLSAIAGLTEHLSCHRLRTGPDVDGAARLICELLR